MITGDRSSRNCGKTVECHVEARSRSLRLIAEIRSVTISHTSDVVIKLIVQAFSTGKYRLLKPYVLESHIE
jgi:hypothetical protein